jgi:two-component system response regulator AtoC
MNIETETILVVDDEEAVRNVLRRMLENIGYQVITAADGQEALYNLSLDKARIVLMDIKMPNMSGIEVLEKLAEDDTSYCIIMVTAVADMQTAIKAMKLGAIDYITKPFDQDEVKEKLAKAIEKHHRSSFEKSRYERLQRNVMEQTERMQEQFNELVSSLAREHRLLHELAAKQADHGKSMLSKLPKELQEPTTSVEEFRDAMLRVLKKR